MILPLNWPNYGAIAVGATGVLALMATGRAFWRWKLGRWASEEGMTIVSFRDAGFWEGPTKRDRSVNEHLFRIEAETPGGTKRKGWAMFVTRWGVTVSASFDWVKWDPAT